MQRIERHGEDCYPHEGAGVMLGVAESDQIMIKELILAENTFDASQRRTRYMIDARSMMHAEITAENRGLEVVGIFHSHPDHPPKPSAFDLEHALPWYAYLITSVEAGKAGISRVWRLQDDRNGYFELDLLIDDGEGVS